MRFFLFVGLVGLAALALALYGAYAPASVEAFSPALGPYARQLQTYLPAGWTRAPVAAATSAQPPTAPPRPPVAVVVGHASRKDFAWRVDAIGTVQPIATVALRPHFDATVDKIFVPDGSAVKAGDILIKLDSRQAEAQLKAAEAQLAKDHAQRDQAKRDVARYSDLVTRSATPVLNLDNAKTTVATTEAAILGDEAVIDNLKVQLGWYTVTAPISGRVGVFNIKAGNLAKAGDNGATGIFASINQVAPIYLTFSAPQALLPALREAMAAGASVTATPQGSQKSVQGRLKLIENTIDSTTGSVVSKAIFDNADEFLWPGQLCNLQITLRVEPNTVVVPREAIQAGQNGSYVFTIVDGVAHVQPVEAARTMDGETKIAKGLNGDETVVVDGQLLLLEGSKVEPRDAKKGAS